MVLLEDIGCLDGIYINGDIIGSFWFVGYWQFLVGWLLVVFGWFLEW